jgi:hypothetical protein
MYGGGIVDAIAINMARMHATENGWHEDETTAKKKGEWCVHQQTAVGRLQERYHNEPGKIQRCTDETAYNNNKTRVLVRKNHCDIEQARYDGIGILSGAGRADTDTDTDTDTAPGTDVGVVASLSASSLGVPTAPTVKM